MNTKRERTYTLVYFQTAIRMRDVFALESTESDWAKGVVYLTEQKTGKRRAYVLDEDALRALRNIGGTWSKPVPYPYKETNPATIAHNNGIDATQLLGHSARWVTQKYYLDSDMGTPMNVGAVLPKLRHRNTSN